MEVKQRRERRGNRGTFFALWRFGSLVPVAMEDLFDG